MHSSSPSQPIFLSGILHFFVWDTLDREENAKKEKKVHSQPNTAPAWAGGYTNPSQGNANLSEGNGMELDTVSPTRHGICC